MNAALKEKLKTLPRTPGVYFHKSKDDEIIYIGKAAILKNRVRQYFQSKADMDVKTRALVAEINDTDWIETESEMDALFLESEMVKRYMPRYNILLRDDKSQTFVRIDMKSEWPTVTFTRNPADDGATYIGPFYSGFAVKKALRYLRKIFPYYIKPPKRERMNLEEQIGLAPSADMTSQEYKKSLRKLIRYIEGGRMKIAKEIECDMKRAARSQEFETAAQLRNKLSYMHELQRRIMFGDREFLDISKDQALAQLAQLLGLQSPPARIEGYDISHMSGRQVVASMVVFTNGASDRAEYRKFKVGEKNDDTGNMYEVIFRRLGERNIKSWGYPDLLLIDGGKGQLSAAIKARDERGIKLPIISIAKREEEIIIHKTGSQIDVTRIEGLQKSIHQDIAIHEDNDVYVVNLHPTQRNAGSHSKNLRGSAIDNDSSRDNFTKSSIATTDIVKLFQRIRDESHRFAVSYHTALKRQNQTKNQLEEIPGIGPKTRAKLLRKFGSVKKIIETDYAELQAEVGAKKADLIKRLS